MEIKGAGGLCKNGFKYCYPEEVMGWMVEVGDSSARFFRFKPFTLLMGDMRDCKSLGDGRSPIGLSETKKVG